MPLPGEKSEWEYHGEEGLRLFSVKTWTYFLKTLLSLSELVAFSFPFSKMVLYEQKTLILLKAK